MNKFTAFEDAALLNMHGLSSTVHGVWRGSVRGRQYRDKNGRAGVEKWEEKWRWDQEILAFPLTVPIFPPPSDIFLSIFLLSLLISSPSLFSIIFCPLMGHHFFVVVWWGTGWKCFKKTDEMRLFCLIVANKSWCNFSQGSHLLGSLQGLSPSSALSQKTLSQAAGCVVMTQQFEVMTTRGRSRVENDFIFSILAEMGCTVFGKEE